MSWYHNFWPFNRARAAEQRQVEAEFQEQLRAAYERHGDLEDAARQLRETREQRTQPRPQLRSRPSFSEV